VNRFAEWSQFAQKPLWLVCWLCLACLIAGKQSAAQKPEQVSNILRIAIDWPESARASSAVRDRVLQKLSSTETIQVIDNSARPDAILHGSATIWRTGYVSTSPRSQAAKEATYQGYASVELSDQSGQALWSYLATPRRSGWKRISDDLGDQLATALIAAVQQLNVASKSTRAANSDERRGTSAGDQTLKGVGATFPAPIYRKWFESFEQTQPGLKVNYDAVGSQEGLRQIRAELVDFGASDMPLPDEQLQNPHQQLLQFATVVGAVVPIYNVKGAPDSLNFTPEVLAGIYLGKIQFWNAPEIRALNKHVRLPADKIVLVHRSDGSGTTYAWTDYLSKVSESWRNAIGAETTVSWPVGVGAEGNSGVADTVAKTPSSIGYVEFIYALQHELSFGAVRNASGEYVKADLDSVTAAAKGAVAESGKGFQTSITNANGKYAYPIATFTWILIPAIEKQSRKDHALHDLARWMLTSGQKQCQLFGYAPLPADLAARELQALDTRK